jgi:type IV pilus assembly protein PilB
MELWIDLFDSFRQDTSSHHAAPVLYDLFEETPRRASSQEEGLGSQAIEAQATSQTLQTSEEPLVPPQSVEVLQEVVSFLSSEQEKPTDATVKNTAENTAIMAMSAEEPSVEVQQQEGTQEVIQEGTTVADVQLVGHMPEPPALTTLAEDPTPHPSQTLADTFRQHAVPLFPEVSSSTSSEVTLPASEDVLETLPSITTNSISADLVLSPAEGSEDSQTAVESISESSSPEERFTPLTGGVALEDATVKESMLSVPEAQETPEAIPHVEADVPQGAEGTTQRQSVTESSAISEIDEDVLENTPLAIEADVAVEALVVTEAVPAQDALKVSTPEQEPLTIAADATPVEAIAAQGASLDTPALVSVDTSNTLPFKDDFGDGFSFSEDTFMNPMAAFQEVASMTTRHDNFGFGFESTVTSETVTSDVVAAVSEVSVSSSDAQVLEAVVEEALADERHAQVPKVRLEETDIQADTTPTEERPLEPFVQETFTEVDIMPEMLSVVPEVIVSLSEASELTDSLNEASPLDTTDGQEDVTLSSVSIGQDSFELALEPALEQALLTEVLPESVEHALSIEQLPHGVVSSQEPSEAETLPVVSLENTEEATQPPSEIARVLPAPDVVDVPDAIEESVVTLPVLSPVTEVLSEVPPEVESVQAEAASPTLQPASRLLEEVPETTSQQEILQTKDLASIIEQTPQTPKVITLAEHKKATQKEPLKLFEATPQASQEKITSSSTETNVAHEKPEDVSPAKVTDLKQVVTPEPSKAKILSGLFEDVPLVTKVSVDICPPPKNLQAHDNKLWVGLVENALVDVEKLQEIIDENRNLKMPAVIQQNKRSNSPYAPLQEVLRHYQLITEENLCEGLRAVYRGRFIEPSQVTCTMAAVFQVPIDFIESREVVPLTYDPKRQRLEILLHNPQDSNLLDELAQVTRVRVAARVTTEQKHQELLNEAYQLAVLEFASGLDGMIDNYDFLGRSAESHVPSRSGVLSVETQQKNLYGLPFKLDGDTEHHATQLVEHFLRDAYLLGASDIHFEVHGDGLMVRYRIDGLLKDILLLPAAIGLNVISRVKVITSLDISQKRLPQDGGTQVILQLADNKTQQIEIRVNTLPTRLGESVCLRLLKPHQVDGMLESLLMSSRMLERLKRLLQMPQGMILVTGPTGSGKTSTLYTCLNFLNHRTRKICTIEDPVEYQLPGICQTQVSVKSGLSFDKSLRAMLRHDPDILMVGEIRDNETLEVAMHAASTGHLVLTTLHTNSAMNTLSRMKELDASPQLLTNTLAGIVAQRLVRKVCPHCSVEVPANHEKLELLGMKSFAERTPEPILFKQAVGCLHCQETGYMGRLAVFEMLTMNRQLARGIEEGVSLIELEDTALAHQLLYPLREDAYEKAKQGLTTLEELLRVLGPVAL